MLQDVISNMTKKICEFEFILIPFKVRPTKDPRQNIHEEYDKKNEKELLPYGEGSFCKFSIDPKYNRPGIYIWDSNNKPKYVGETSGPLSERVYGYGHISPANCWKPKGQATNVKINYKICREIEEGNEIKLYFCEQNTSEEKRREIEREIMAELDPLWNNKDVELTRHVDSD